MAELKQYQGTYQVAEKIKLPKMPFGSNTHSEIVPVTDLDKDAITSWQDIVPNKTIFLAEAGQTISKNELGTITPTTQKAAAALKQAFANNDFHLYVNLAANVDIATAIVPSGAILNGRVVLGKDVTFKDSIVNGAHTQIDFVKGKIVNSALINATVLDHDQTHQIEPNYRKHLPINIENSKVKNAAIIGGANIKWTTVENNILLNNTDLYQCTVKYDFARDVSASYESFHLMQNAKEAIVLKDSQLDLIDAILTETDNEDEENYEQPKLSLKLNRITAHQSQIKIKGTGKVVANKGMLYLTAFKLQGHNANLRQIDLQHCNFYNETNLYHVTISGLIAETAFSANHVKMDANSDKPLFVNQDIEFNHFIMELEDAFAILKISPNMLKVNTKNELPKNNFYFDTDIKNSKYFTRVNNDYAYKELVKDYGITIYEDNPVMAAKVGQFTAPHDLL